MIELPTALYTAAQVRELDRIAIEELGIPGYTLMQRAGRAVFDCITERYSGAHRWLILTGGGNNGGDGYVVAGLARTAGQRVTVMQFGDPTHIQGAALEARNAYLAAGGTVQAYDGGTPQDCDLIVDALLGTGLTREVKPGWAEAIHQVNAHPAPIIAVDIPSGLQSDTGMPLGSAIKASTTVTFIGLKQGLFTGQAADHRGELLFDDLGVPRQVQAGVQPAAVRIELAQLKDRLGPRARTSHKGHFGHVLIVGGDAGTAGAVRMTAEAAARGGAGLVSVATRAAHASLVSADFPVIMAHGVESPQALLALVNKATVIAIGPGLGQSAWGRGMLATVLDTDKPLVMDADGLNLLAYEPCRRDNWILTPHPREAARLLNFDAAGIQSDRYRAARGLQQKFGGVSVLKGAGSIIASSTRTAVNAGGNPGMASGGMGDVLTGLIAGLVAQHFTLPDAAELGVCLHAAAADRAARAGERGLIATDLFAQLRPLLNP